METEEKKWCVYIHKNKINNKAYIGIAKGNPKKRWGSNGCKYTEQQKIFHNAIQKYGWNNFEHIIWAENLSEKEAKEWEIRLIAIFKTNCCRYQNPAYGYNMTDGGEGPNGVVRSNEFKEKISKANKGKQISQETRLKLSQANKGKHLGRNNPMYGRYHSEETKEIFRAQRNGKYCGDKNPMFGKNHPQEVKDKMRECKRNIFRAIYCIELNEIFESIREAERKLGIDNAQISACCKGKQGYNSAGKHPITGEKLHWKYLEDAIKLGYIIDNVNGGKS